MGKTKDGKLECAYCGKIREKVMFVIGASREPDWVMVEGTGKITCPDCWDKATAAGRDAVDGHVAWGAKEAQKAQA